MSRRPYVLTKGASADLRGISRHTAETWGEAQRRAYVQQFLAILHERMELITRLKRRLDDRKD